MAKTTFSSLGLKQQSNIVTIIINEKEIEVKQYLPINEKLALIDMVAQAAMSDENQYINPMKIDVFTKMEILEFYTNITFTEKQEADLPKQFDILESNHIFDKIIEAIPVDEYESLVKGIYNSIQSIYEYRTSLLGVMKETVDNYEQTDFNATEIQKKLADPENLAMLKDVLTKLG